MRKTLLVPGAARLACSMWPLQARDDHSLIPIDYPRGYRFDHDEDSEQYLLGKYALRIFDQIDQFDEEIDIIAWSMGLPIVTRVAQLLDQHRPGQLQNIVGINPGVFGGQLPTHFHNFHLNPVYVANLWLGSSIKKGTQTNEALRKIKKKIHHFNYQTRENTVAMLEAGAGVMKFTDDFDYKRLHIWYVHQDQVIPTDITEFVAERVGVKPVMLKGYEHDLPLQDTDGEILEKIRKSIR